MRITFLLPNINLRGGIRGVLDYSNLLAESGDDVTVVFPTRLARLPLPLNEIEYLWRAPHKLLFGRWFTTRARVLAVPSLTARYIPRADVVVATAWQTAEWVSTYPTDRGQRYYFIQDIETHESPERAEATYAMDFRRIVTTPWIRDQLRERFGVSVQALVPYGLDLALYTPPDYPVPPHPLVIGTLYDKARRKGFDVAFRVVERLRMDHPEVVLRVFGVPRRPPRLPSFVLANWRIKPRDTPQFYRFCHIWLCASRSEGFYLPGMEAMACGCAVVTSRVGGTVYYAIPERTALVTEPGDAEGLYRAAKRLLDDADLRQRLSADGARYVRRYDIRDAAKNMLRALRGESVIIEPDTGLTATHCD